MWKDLIQEITGVLETVSAVNKVYPYALRDGDKIDGYPAVVFFPDTGSNEFMTESQNRKEYRFILYVVVSVENTTNKKVATEILPNVVDQIIAKFDTDWDKGTIVGSRAWWVIDSSSPWTLPYTDSGVEMTAPLNLRVSFINPI